MDEILSCSVCVALIASNWHREKNMRANCIWTQNAQTNYSLFTIWSRKRKKSECENEALWKNVTLFSRWKVKEWKRYNFSRKFTKHTQTMAIHLEMHMFFRGAQHHRRSSCVPAFLLFCFHFAPLILGSFCCVCVVAASWCCIKYYMNASVVIISHRNYQHIN